MAEFVRDLEALWAASGLTNAEIARAGGLTPSTVSRIICGDKPPTWEMTRRFVKACGGDEAEWQARHDAMSVAVERDNRKQLQLVDLPYREMEPPRSPTEFNRALQRRIKRHCSQRTVAKRANYQPSTVSTNLTANRIASLRFVKAILKAAGADETEIAVWSTWQKSIDAAHASPSLDGREARKLRGRAAKAFLILSIGLTTAMLWATGNHQDPGHPPGPAVASPRQSDRPGLGGTSERPPFAAPSATAVTTGTASPSGRTPTTTPTRPPVPDDLALLVPATIVGTGGAPWMSGWPPSVQPGQRVDVVCQSTTAGPNGWYYVDQGYFVEPTNVRFSNDQDVTKIAPCNKIDFQKYGLTSPNDRTQCLVHLTLMSCTEAKSPAASAGR